MIAKTSAPICDHVDTPTPAVVLVPALQPLADAAAMFRALGDPQRLRLLVRLAAGEVCVGELVAQEGEKFSTISARLKTLNAVRLVKSRRDAKHVFYALADEHVLAVVQSALDHASEHLSHNSTQSSKERQQ